MPKQLDPAKQYWNEPVIYPKDPSPADMAQPWRIFFTYYDINSGVWGPVTRKSVINTYTNFKERLTEVNALKAALKFKLKTQGWNPLTNTYETPEVPLPDIDQELGRLKYLAFNEALDYAYRQKLKDWSKKTGQHCTNG